MFPVPCTPGATKLEHYWPKTLSKNTDPIEKAIENHHCGRRITIARNDLKRHRQPMLCDANWFSRLSLIAAGFLGAGGTIAAAGASHTDDARLLGALALIALAHAGVFLAFALLSATGRLLRSGALIIGTGVALFSVDLVFRHFFEHALFPMSAPIGGALIIAGWTLIAVVGAIGRRG
jgi:uncharacterized membrane protein YgdD (TMEM256/DUF423 family)